MIDEAKLLSGVPEALRDSLLEEYRGICRAFSEGRWKLSALDAGRFCETAFTILEGALTGSYAVSPAKPSNFVAACRALENRAPVAVGDRSLRILIPRVLPALYEIRNNRNVGHVGGDVTANMMDASFCRETCAWVVAELVRIFHGVGIDEAQRVVDSLVERAHPLVWEAGEVKRVLSPDMKAADRALVLLYSSPGWLLISQLQKWVRYQANFRRQVLSPLFDKQLVELSKDSVLITPLGIRHVEEKILPAKPA